MMYETPTMIIPSWVLILMYGLPTLLFSFLLGYIVMGMMRKQHGTLLFTSLFISLFSAWFIFYSYKPTVRIVVPHGYVGEVRLFVTDNVEEESDLQMSEYGIGYVSGGAYKRGFRTKVIQDGADITRDVKSFAQCTFSSTSLKGYKLSYLSFEIAGAGKEAELNVDDLIDMGAIDTARLRRN